MERKTHNNNIAKQNEERRMIEKELVSAKKVSWMREREKKKESLYL